jgi:4-aminobutyrate aminotransferase-like enzyme
MERACDSCQTLYTAKSPLSRYCSSRCAKRAQRTGLSRSAAEPAVVAVVPSGAGAVEAAVRSALEAAGQLSAPLGQVALTLARRLDAPGGESGSGLASLAKQLTATLAAATADVRPAGDLLHELRARRDRKLGHPGGRS